MPRPYTIPGTTAHIRCGTCAYPPPNAKKVNDVNFKRHENEDGEISRERIVDCIPRTSIK